jgi:ABC-type dipeptide/oligopeptide/nickel transport system ATPase component
MNKILEIKNLHIHFRHHHQAVKADEGVDLDIYEGEILALVGQSGSGKTVTGLSITRILPPSAEIISGEVIFQDQDLLKAGPARINAIRGRDISYIFQEAAASLNPVLAIGRQITESIMLHQNKTKKDAWDLALDALTQARLSRPESIMRSYPHQLSGGMNQRVMIAMAICVRPRLLIADEPTTALDVTVEAEVIAELLALKERFNFSILFITHNLSLVEKFAHRVAIMHKGRVVEQGASRRIFASPVHPHTRELIDSIIRI